MLMDLARQLGIALAGTPEYKRMHEAYSAAMANEALSTLLSAYLAKRGAMFATLSNPSSERALLFSLSSDVERLQAQLMEIPQFSDMLESERAFSALISAVDQEINACIEYREDAQPLLDTLN